MDPIFKVFPFSPLHLSLQELQDRLLQSNNKASRWEEPFQQLSGEPFVSLLLAAMPSTIQQVPKGAFEPR